MTLILTVFLPLLIANIDDAPLKDVTGTLTDEATGEPLTGKWVNCQPVFPDRYGPPVTTKTEAGGRFRLADLPEAPKYVVRAGGPPHFIESTEIAPGPDGGLPRADFTLQRGTPLRVRVTDVTTGKPVANARVQFLPRAGNPHLKSLTSFRRNYNDSARFTDAKGVAELTAIPGPGWVAAGADPSANYTRGRIPGGPLTERWFDTGATRQEPLNMFHAVAEVEIGTDPKEVEVTLRPGREVTVHVTGPGGEALTDVKACGLSALAESYHARAPDGEPHPPRFRVHGLAPDDPRIVVFVHEEKKLARAVTLRGDEVGPVIVKLEPLGSLSGRLVNKAGKPWAASAVEVSLGTAQHVRLPGDFFPDPIGDVYRAIKIQNHHTDPEGRFRIDGFVAGLRYDLAVHRYDGTGRKSARVKAGIAIKAGQNRDLGTINVDPVGF